ncbi:hypothetical protein KKG83_02115 [Candidatus Micrarchaeota archaeon]|nr:hypothetical protein [Candidatus Micrarchaeota archaeon]
MNKVSLILISLILVSVFSSFALAESGDNVETDDNKNEINTENNDLDIGEDAQLEESDEQELSEEEIEDETDSGSGKIKPYIRTLFFSGTGIAPNPLDAMDFYTVKVVGGKVVTSTADIIGRGILYLDKTKYRLVDLDVNGDHATAKILSINEPTTTSEISSAEVGTLDVTKIAKPGVDVWAGKMTLDGKDYHFYLITHKRLFNAKEIAEKAKNYCKDHPFDETCKSVAGYLCKDNPKECRLKVERYCEDHSTDSRCKEIVRNYCASNLKDSRCREELKDYCEENSEAEICSNEVVDFCKENPKNERCRNVFSEYCKNHPKDLSCTRAAIEKCKENPTAESCAPIIKQFCEYNQKSELCGGIKIDYCTENPKALRCQVTATALCTLDKFSNTDQCKEIKETVRERVKAVVAGRNLGVTE